MEPLKAGLGQVHWWLDRGRAVLIMQAGLHFSTRCPVLQAGPGSSLLLNILNIHTNTHSPAQTNQHTLDSPSALLGNNIFYEIIL